MYGARRDASLELPLHGCGLALPARPVHPDRGRPRSQPRVSDDHLHRGRARRRSDRGADGQSDRGARGPLRPRHRRPAERDVRQCARADHRALRAERRAAGGREGLAHRLGAGQRAARARRRHGVRRHRPSEAGVPPHCRHGADDDAAARRRRAPHADGVRTRAGDGPPAGGAGDREGARGCQDDVGCRRDHPPALVRRRAHLLAAHPQGPVQPR